MTPSLSFASGDRVRARRPGAAWRAGTVKDAHEHFGRLMLLVHYDDDPPARRHLVFPGEEVEVRRLAEEVGHD